MALIYRKNKETGTVYVYESKPYWDREKKQTRSRRVCIGKLDEKGELILSSRFFRPLPEILAGGNAEGGSVTQRLYAGAVDLLDQVGLGIGFPDELRICFPVCYRLLLSVIYFLILEGNAPLARIERWSHTHEHPARETLLPVRVFSLLTVLPEEGMNRFLSRMIPLLSLQPLRSGLALDERAVCGMGFAMLSAMILLSDVLRRMSKNSFFSGWTAQQVFDRLDVIECFEGPGGMMRMGYVSARQDRLYRELGVAPPVSFGEFHPAG